MHATNVFTARITYISINAVRHNGWFSVYSIYRMHKLTAVQNIVCLLVWFRSISCYFRLSQSNIIFIIMKFITLFSDSFIKPVYSSQSALSSYHQQQQQIAAFSMAHDVQLILKYYTIRSLGCRLFCLNNFD